jgi:hypothetical protein
MSAHKPKSSIATRVSHRARGRKGASTSGSQEAFGGGGIAFGRERKVDRLSCPNPALDTDTCSRLFN